MKFAVLISGSGSNLQALIDACKTPDYPANLCVVLSNQPDAYGLERARLAGIPTEIVRPRDFENRAAYDRHLAVVLGSYGAEWVVLAGFMRIITEELLRAFPQRILNIHPSLLPAFPGLHAQKQAWEAGVRISGASVHLVDGGMDTGPLIAQGAVPVLPTDDENALQQRILRMEHRLYPRVVRWAAEGRIHVEQGRVRLDLPSDESTSWFDPTP